MKRIGKIVGTAFSLWLGAAVIIYAITLVDVAVRLNYWASRSEYPNMDPRIMYTFALFALVVIALISGLVELLRQWVFDRRPLYWWQLVIVGATYPLYFTSVALRHIVGLQAAEILSVALAVLLCPFGVYWVFSGYKQAKSA
jgi:hypothetical protein